MLYGYNSDIESGIRKFGSGISLALRERAKKLGVEPGKVIALAKEAELEEFAAQLVDREDENNPSILAFAGLTFFVHALTEGARRVAEATGVDFFDALQQQIDHTARLVYQLDQIVQSTGPRLDRLQAAADWIAQQHVGA